MTDLTTPADSVAITATKTFNALTIMFGDVPHLKFRTDNMLGMQSWRTSDTSFSVELYFSKGAILCEYDNEDKWKQVIKIVEDVI